jgi:hypothetical protein
MAAASHQMGRFVEPVVRLALEPHVLPPTPRIRLFGVAGRHFESVPVLCTFFLSGEAAQPG